MEEDVKKVLSRREFLKFAGIAGAAIDCRRRDGWHTRRLRKRNNHDDRGDHRDDRGRDLPPPRPPRRPRRPRSPRAPRLPTETLKVGAVLSLTDWYSVVDAADKVDTEYVAQMINDEGGIKAGGKAYKVELVIEDGKSSLDGNTAAATKLVLDNKAAARGRTGRVLQRGYFPDLRAEQSTARRKLQRSRARRDEQRHAVRVPGSGPHSPAVGRPKSSHAAVSLTVKTVTMATEDATYPPFEQAFKDLVTRTGLTLAGDPVLFATNAEDYNPTAAKIKSQNPDGVWMPIGIPPSFAGIAKGLRTLGYAGPIVCPVDAPTHIALVGPEASTDLVGILSKSLEDPNIAAPLKKLMEMGDPKRQIFGLAPNALYMLKYAIEAADSIDPTAIRDKWESLTTIPTLYGEGFPSGEPAVWSDEPCLGLPDPGMPDHATRKIEYKPWIKPDVTP